MSLLRSAENAGNKKVAERKSVPRRVALEIGLLVALVGVALYVWGAPMYRERTLKTASFESLLALSKREPNNPRVFYYLGIRLYQLGHPAPAEAALARAATLDADDENLWLSWAAIAGMQTSDRKAFGILTTFVKNHPNSAAANRSLAMLYQQKDAFQRAFETGQIAARLNPKDTLTWRLVGTSALQLNKLVEAKDAFQKAVALEPGDWRNRKGLGDSLKAGREYEAALASYEQAARLAPQEPAALYVCGQMRLQQAKDDGAVKNALMMLDSAAKLAPNLAGIKMEQGKALSRLNRIDAARTALSQAAALAPSDPEIPFLQKQIAEKSGDHDAALQFDARHRALADAKERRYVLFSRVWQDQTNGELRLQYARLLTEQGDAVAALESYDRLLALKPAAPLLAVAQSERNALLKNNPGLTISAPILLPVPEASRTRERPVAELLRDANAMVERGRYTEAESVYKTVVERDATAAEAFEGLGLLYQRQGKTDEAFPALQRAIALNPRRDRTAYMLARIYFEAGFPDEAAKRMEAALQQQPNNPEYWHALGLARVGVGSTEGMQKARAAFARAAELDAANPTAFRDLANVESELQQNDNAERHYREALKLSPDDPISLYSLGGFLLTYRSAPERVKEAESLLKKAVATAPDNPLAALHYGTLLLKQGKTDAAIKFLEIAVEGNSDEPKAWYQLSRAYQRAGEKDKAAYCLKEFRAITDRKTRLNNAEEAARMNLKDPARRLALARVYAQAGQNAKAINQYEMCLSLEPGNKTARAERDAFIARLKATGQAPEMHNFNGMITASTVNQEASPAPPPSARKP